MDIILKLVDCTRSKHNITLLYKFHEVTFTTTLWYSTVDFHQLEAEYGQEYMNKLYFHLLLFHGLKILSLKPTHLDLGKFSGYWNPQLEKLWDISVEQCLGQWRYVSGNLDYQGAQIISENISSVQTPPVEISPGEISLLVCNGGGKDSLLMARLLDDNDIQFDSFDINYHTALDPELHLELNEQHLYELQNPPSKIHRQYVIESFFNSPAAKLHGVESLEISRTKDYESLPLAYGAFGILPIILQDKYTVLCYGNEKSSDKEHVRVMGLEAHNAFECVGEIEENKLAFEKCVERGITGKAIDCYVKEARLDQVEYQKLWKKYNEIDLSYVRLPKQLEEIMVNSHQELQKSRNT